MSRTFESRYLTLSRVDWLCTQIIWAECQALPGYCSTDDLKQLYVGLQTALRWQCLESRVGAMKTCPLDDAPIEVKKV